MRVSPLRLRLAGGFALAFALGLALLAALGFAALSRESTRRFDLRLDSVVGEAVRALQREHADMPDSSLAFIAGEVAGEWSDTNGEFVMFDMSNRQIGAFDPDGVVPRIKTALGNARGKTRFNLERSAPDLRLLVADVTPFANTPQAAPLARTTVRIVAFGSTEGMEADAQLLGLLFGVSAPLILLISLFAGYLLAGRALKPVRALANAMSAIAPEDLHTRLPAEANSASEVSAVATEFNALLVRLQLAQKQNGQFVRETAHQIRTPLTLVLGEASHALASESGAAVNDPARMRATLGRIRTAAEVMRRRVDELFLLAEARTGEAVRLEEQVELDDLLLNCTDLMRARASETGHRLAIGRADPIVILGHSALLHEALLELLENACRHGDTSMPITVSCRIDGANKAILSVASGGKAFELPQGANESLARGMGLSIVRWVAESHHGEMRVVRIGGANNNIDEGVNEVELIFSMQNRAR
ncbi:MAG: HAMP domain-containing histidine kinase [Gemmatimonadota bacterium]|nr:HAMP domain-containing histidine kinase [Gemmatimonadota bacterium]